MDKLTKWFVGGFFVFLWLQIPPQLRSDIVNGTIGALFAGVKTTASTTAATATPYVSRSVAGDATAGNIMLALMIAGVLWFALHGKVITQSGGGGRPQGGGGGGGGKPQNSGSGGRPAAGSSRIDLKKTLPVVVVVSLAVFMFVSPQGQQLLSMVPFDFGGIVNQVRSLMP